MRLNESDLRECTEDMPGVVRQVQSNDEWVMCYKTGQFDLYICNFTADVMTS